MAFLAALLVPLTALIIAPGVLFYFDVTPKLAFLLALTAAIISAWAFRGPTCPKRPRWIQWVLLFGIGSLSLSTIYSANPMLSLFGTAWRRYGALEQTCILTVAFLTSAYIGGQLEHARMILRGIPIGALAASAYGVGQYFGWDPLLPRAAYHIGEGVWTIVRPPGTLGNSNYFAAWLVMACFASLASLEAETNVTWRRLAGAAACLSVCAVLLTGTRGANLGLAAGAAVWMAWRDFPLTRRTAARVAAAALLGVTFYFSAAGAQLRSRTRWFVEDPWGGARLYLWRDSARMARDRPAYGYGPEVYSAAFPRYESVALAAAFPDFAHESPHNIFLDAAVAQGLPGIAALCALCAGGLAAAWRLRARSRGIASGLAAALGAGIISQQFVVFTIPTALLFFSLVAIAAGLTGEARPLPARPFGALGAVAAVALLYLSLRFVLADRALEHVQRHLNAGDAAAAGPAYASYEHWRLPGTGADLWYSRALLELSHRTHDPAAAVEAVAEGGKAAWQATRTAEYPANAWYNLAAFYASQNDAANAERSLRAAIAANEKWFKPHWSLARLLLIELRLTEAEQQSALAAALAGGKFPDVTVTQQQILTRLGATPVKPK